MNTTTLYDTPLTPRLRQQAQKMALPANHLGRLIKDSTRRERLCLHTTQMLCDFSHQRVDQDTMALLVELATMLELPQRFEAMCQGAKVNVTENRAALHTAARSLQSGSLVVDGEDVLKRIDQVRERMREFTDQVHQGHLRGSTGKPFKDIVVIGIGGSYLGTAFVSEALHAWADHGLSLRYLSNVDIHDFGRIVSEIDVERTLWVVISKSYTTAETLANTNQVKAYLRANGLDPAQHLVTVTSKGSPGDSQDEPVLEAFHMFDFIGGRYSVTSAVGGVPLSLLLGYDQFERFLKGAAEMDQHAAKAPTSQNLPLLAAMIGIWNYYFLGYPAQAIIPYAAPLRKLPAHIQQLYMESIGKAVDQQGNPLPEPAGVIVFGEPGTNAQHSFFQLAHQGRPFPIDFIGVVKPQYDQYHAQTNGVTNHQELWANMLSQSLALAVGRDDPNPAKQFSGNRPSSILLLNDLQPESIGALLAFYEAKTVYEAFALGINAFDQFGVELGKTIASGIRKSIAAQNAQPGCDLEQVEAMPRFYLDILARGSF